MSIKKKLFLALVVPLLEDFGKETAKALAKHIYPGREEDEGEEEDD